MYHVLILVSSQNGLEFFECRVKTTPFPALVTRLAGWSFPFVGKGARLHEMAG
jgi:hypothetical protein